MTSQELNPMNEKTKEIGVAGVPMLGALSDTLIEVQSRGEKRQAAPR